MKSGDRTDRGTTRRGTKASLLRARWQPGPDPDPADAPVWISVTEFTADGHRRALGVALNGLRLRRGWPATDGAVGMWLWADPRRRRSGAVSVWSGGPAIAGFVGRPDHARIAGAFRAHGTMRATLWSQPRFDAAAAWGTAHDLLVGATPWPEEASR
ncbi:hypothetical protein V2W30_30735 [Streptomyces sp. Q6]|uniref:Uncharacterized protein n=1 Tax=Streptomyces citrinus TaxID=3118173 RepID=A0ACD5AJ58_9ACTN